LADFFVGGVTALAGAGGPWEMSSVHKIATAIPGERLTPQLSHLQTGEKQIYIRLE